MMQTTPHRFRNGGGFRQWNYQSFQAFFILCFDIVKKLTCSVGVSPSKSPAVTVIIRIGSSKIPVFPLQFQTTFQNKSRSVFVKYAVFLSARKLL
ncbi:MAG: hypothetical protein L6V93_09175 [Clostridiales bacterium]|nr:MAG: hypothetical protein L6V93_09175 [Clostridiales bacterium]